MVNDKLGIYEKKQRSKYITDAMEKHQVTYPAVRKYLRKYCVITYQSQLGLIYVS